MNAEHPTVCNLYRQKQKCGRQLGRLSEQGLQGLFDSRTHQKSEAFSHPDKQPTCVQCQDPREQARSATHAPPSGQEELNPPHPWPVLVQFSTSVEEESIHQPLCPGVGCASGRVLEETPKFQVCSIQTASSRCFSKHQSPPPSQEAKIKSHIFSVIMPWLTPIFCASLEWCHSSFNCVLFSPICARYCFLLNDVTLHSTVCCFHPSAQGIVFSWIMSLFIQLCLVFTHLHKVLFSPHCPLCEAQFSPGNLKRCRSQAQQCGSLLETLTLKSRNAEHWNSSADDHSVGAACRMHSCPFCTNKAALMHLSISSPWSVHQHDDWTAWLWLTAWFISTNMSIAAPTASVQPAVTASALAPHTNTRAGRRTKRWWWLEGATAVTGSMGLEAWGTGKETHKQKELLTVRILKFEVFKHRGKLISFQKSFHCCHQLQEIYQ